MAEKKKWHPTEAVPCNLSKYTPKKRGIIPGDFYVSVCGNDAADGSVERPFATLEKARDAVRQKRLSQQNEDRTYTVSIMEGTYCRAEKGKLQLDAEDGNTRYVAHSDGEVCFTGGVSFNREDFLPIAENDKMNTVFPHDAIEHIICIDMNKYPLAKAHINAAQNGKPCEIFINGKRAHLPRYPESSSARTGEVINDTDYKGAGGTFVVDADTRERMKAWHDLSNVCVDGYFCVDWSNARIPIEKYDAQTGRLTTLFLDSYGLAENCPYFFVNVPEEMNTPDTYYMDSERGLLYVYPDGDAESLTVEMSILNEPFIEISNADNITVEGLKFRLSRDKAISFTGNYITIKNCTIENIYEVAIDGEGLYNTVSECEVAHVGKCGINLRAGDKPTLTNGYALIDNNVVHNWGEVNKTGVHAVSVVGVHNRISHNELYDAPHNALHYSGQDHLIEYNYIHHVVQETSDMGATYSGFHWESQGCVLRYNCICNVGNESHGSNGIYWDDMLGGQTGYGNILINIAGHGFIIGGGRDHWAYNNIVVNPGGYPVNYDQRGCDWEKHFALDKNCQIWKNLFSVPFRSEKWKDKFPSLSKITEEPDFENPNFPPTPANSRIMGNVFISTEDCYIMEKTRQFSNIGNNVKLDVDDDAGFVDRKNGNYNFRPDSPVFDKIPAFENLPFEKMGRY